MTKTNFKEPWIVFEAGALSKLPESRVVPLLCCINPWDIVNTPLSQFPAVKVSKEGIQEVITDIAKRASKPLPKRQVMAAFEKWWPDFEKEYNSIQFATKTSDEKEEDDDAPQFTAIENVLQDIIKNLRRIEQMIQFHVTLADVPEGSLGNTSSGLGSLFGLLPRGSLSPSELATLANIQSSENALKLAKALQGQKTLGRGMVKPEPISSGDNEPGDGGTSQTPSLRKESDRPQ